MNYNYSFNDYMFANGMPFPNNNVNNNPNFNYNNGSTINFNTSINNKNNVDNSNINHNLVEPFEGFIRGNLFNNLYEQYKNYRPVVLKASNEMEESLLNLDVMSFAAHELRLYLDIYPNDSRMIELFNEYQTMANQAMDAYERSFGPITQSALSNTNEFEWQSTTWPWEMEVM